MSHLDELTMIFGELSIGLIVTTSGSSPSALLDAFREETTEYRDDEGPESSALTIPARTVRHSQSGAGSRCAQWPVSPPKSARDGEQFSPVGVAALRRGPNPRRLYRWHGHVVVEEVP
jgi:hypothetical protein